MAVKTRQRGLSINSGDVLEGEYYNNPETGVGPLVYVHPLRELESTAVVFSNPTLGVELNIDSSFSGTPANVHDGEDNVYWTGSSIIGTKFTFNSTAITAQSGAQSIEVDRPSVNDVLQFAKGSDLDFNNYTGVTMFVNVSSNWQVGDSISFYGWDTDTSLQVGDAVLLENLFNFSVFGGWQKISIPLSDMGALETSTIADAFRLEIVAKSGATPTFYLDVIRVEETGGANRFSIEPEEGTWLHVDAVTMQIVNNISGTLADATHPYNPYDTLLGQTLSSGLDFIQMRGGLVQFSFTVAGMMDWLQLADLPEFSGGSDGTNTWLIAAAAGKRFSILKSERNDSLSVTSSDDLSGLVRLRFIAHGAIENRA